ncbi:sensor histidine kinase [Actinocorallia populi]|uniref:sensor histidine kinase n=1 Tax=Actinocorallia populi TaxID=2079200 RepID=UPI000D087495|nr:HAMP domain-containing sensor histidine kinase [Actinocorallia populi]
MRLSTRFTLCVALLVSVLVALSGLLVLRMAVDGLAKERDHRLTVRLRSLEPMAAIYARRVVRRNTGDAAGQRISAAATGSGGVLIAPAGAEPLVIGTVPGELPALSGEPATTSDGRWRHAGTGLGRDGGLGTLWVFEPEAVLARQASRLRNRLLLATLAAMLLSAAAGYGIGRVAVRPLSRLSGETSRIDLSPGGGRLPTSSGVTEIDDLARLVNDLLERRDGAVARTGEALEAARAFAATAAHELRTPLTSMSANVGLLSHPELPEEDREEILEDLAREQARMQRLITMLRQLARGELLDPASFTEVDLSALAGLAVEDARRRHPRAVVVADLPGRVAVRGWPEGLRLLLDNLLDNAALHGADPSGGARIDITLHPAGETALLRVRDRGPGIPPDHAAEVFERFRRRPGSPGSGLGLTLVRQQAVLHGGTAFLAPAPPGGGALLHVELPLQGRAPSPLAASSWRTTRPPPPAETANEDG